MKAKAVFLDRDVTVNVGVPTYERVDSLEKVKLLPNSLEALTELGRQQAREAAEDIKDHKIDRIITSKLQRARQTANEVAKVIGFDPKKIEIDNRIIEYDMGAITGTPIRKVTSAELTSAKGAEDSIKFRDKILSFLEEYKDNPKNILIVTHAA